MLNNIFIIDFLVAIAASAFITLKAVEFRRALQLGREETLPGTMRSVIRCLVGRGRTFNINDGGLWYMVVLAGGGAYIMAELALSLMAEPLLPTTISLFASVVVLAGSMWFIVSSVKKKVREGYWMDMLPIIALPLVALNRMYHYTSSGGIYEQHLFYYFAVLFVAGAFPHGLASMVNIYYKNRGPLGKSRPFDLKTGPLGATTVEDLPWKIVLDGLACANCGRCQDNCPASMSGKLLSPRQIVQKVLRQTRATLKESCPQSLHDVISQEEIWACSMCMACVKNCPLYIGHVNIILELRRSTVLKQAQFPAETHTMLRNLELYGDAQGLGAANRQQWALDLSLPHITKTSQPEYLLWFGCSPEYIPDYKRTIRNMVHILEKAKVSFGVLGKDELCCGDPARRQGEEEVFQNLTRKNVEKLNGLGIKKIIAMCPHCFNTMKRVYPEFNGNFQVQHATELIEQLIDEARLDFKYPIDKKITMHDPCYLGRVNNLTGGVRKIINAIPGTEFMELPRNKENSYCCGGGGAQMWLHESPGNRISTLRVQEIQAKGCRLTATACPYCLAMLGSEMKSCDESGEFEFMDVIDMAAYSTGCDCEG